MSKFLLFIIFAILFGNVYSQENPKENYNLMPWPKELSKAKGYFIIYDKFTIRIDNRSGDDQKVIDASTRFLRNLTDKTGIFIDQGFANKDIKGSKPSLLISLENSEEVRLGLDESYTLMIKSDQIEISAKTDIGAMHGLTSLLQLVTVNNKAFVFPNLTIHDSPRFIWRGLMMDVARHFMPVDVIKRNLDAMAYVKMNVFHWHLSDDQGFRVEIKELPNLHLKASDGQFYTQEQIKDVVKYAGDRGIRVIPEFDIPGHGTAFVTAYPEIASKDTVYQLERYAGIFNPTLDPTNERTYEILNTLFGEIAPLFPNPYFHIGGDENEGKHWDENKSIQSFMKKNNLKNNHELQTYFNIRIQKILEKYNKILMGWDEIMTKNMPKDVIIHSWRTVKKGEDPKQIEAAKKGYQTVLSNGYYIDLMLPASSHYLKDPVPDGYKISKDEEALIIGGEATMWSELVTPLTIDSRIWPRTAAIAERFWSPKEVNKVDNMYRRLAIIDKDLERIGITHIRNKEVILRNISNYQNINALQKLSGISEPLKVYTRNNGGKQYKSYSPFTLFADACNVDAADAIAFEVLTKNYISNKDVNAKNKMLAYLKSWKEIDAELGRISSNAPLILNILPYSKRISEISVLFETGLQQGEFSKTQYDRVKVLLNKKEDPKKNLDVELAVEKSLQQLAEFLKKE